MGNKVEDRRRVKKKNIIINKMMDNANNALESGLHGSDGPIDDEGSALSSHFSVLDSNRINVTNGKNCPIGIGQSDAKHP